MASDLRDVVAALKISGVVERIGDYAKNIAKRVPQLENMGKIEPLSLLPEMARIATEMVHDVLDAFVERDAEAALRVCERDNAVDDRPEAALVGGGEIAGRQLVVVGLVVVVPEGRDELLQFGQRDVVAHGVSQHRVWPR